MQGILIKIYLRQHKIRNLKDQVTVLILSIFII